MTFAGFAAFVIERMGTLSAEWDQIARLTIPSLDYAGELTWAIGRYRIAEARHVISQDLAEMATLDREIAETEAKIREILVRYAPALGSAEERALFAQMAGDLERYIEGSRTGLSHSSRLDNEAAARLLAESGARFTVINARIGDLARLNRAYADARGVLITGTFDASLRTSFGLVGLVAVIAVALVVLFKLTVLRPVAGLAESVRRLDAGDFETPVAARDRSDELGSIAQALDTLKGNAAEKERLEQQERADLAFAHEIQLASVPRRFPAFPDRPEFDIHGRLVPTRAVGGDFFDFYLFDPQHLVFTIADTSGKGVASALFAATAHSVIKTTSLRTLEPASCMTEINRIIAADNDAMMFVTAFHGVLELDTGVMHYANAGHNPPYVLHADGRVAALATRAGVAIGPLEEYTYQAGRVVLARGDTLVLFTDGVTEATAADDELFGEARLRHALEQQVGARPEAIVDAMFHAIEGFVRGAPQADDITVMVLRYEGAVLGSAVTDRTMVAAV